MFERNHIFALPYSYSPTYLIINLNPTYNPGLEVQYFAVSTLSVNFFNHDIKIR